MQIIHSITIEPVSQGERGQRYRATYAGAVLVDSSRNPEFDACRALLARGITGKLETWWRGRLLPRDDPRHRGSCKANRRRKRHGRPSPSALAAVCGSQRAEWGFLPRGQPRDRHRSFGRTTLA